MVSISIASAFERVESCLVWPFLLCSCVLVAPRDRFNKVSLRKDPFCIGTLSVCRLSLARCSNSRLCFCCKACMRREKLILNKVTTIDISDLSSATFFLSSKRLGRIWSSFTAKEIISHESKRATSLRAVKNMFKKLSFSIVTGLYLLLTRIIMLSKLELKI